MDYKGLKICKILEPTFMEDNKVFKVNDVCLGYETNNNIVIVSGDYAGNIYPNIKKSDLLFLDMEINEENGIDIGLELQELKHDCRIIITTSYSKYAIDGYKIHADRYFIKPINQLEFNLEMEAIIKKYIKL